MGIRELKKLFQTKKREITLALVSIMVLGLFFSGSSMGKQFNSVDIETNGKIAEPIIRIENGPITEVSGKNEQACHCFKIKNYNEKGEVTQIDLTYYVEILFQTEEAISFQLYKDGQEVPFENNKTAKMSLQKEVMKEDDYQLKIIYDKTKNHARDELFQEVQIKVYAEQSKG